MLGSEVWSKLSLTLLSHGFCSFSSRIDSSSSTLLALADSICRASLFSLPWINSANEKCYIYYCNIYRYPNFTRLIPFSRTIKHILNLTWIYLTTILTNVLFFIECFLSRHQRNVRNNCCYFILKECIFDILIMVY